MFESARFNLNFSISIQRISIKFNFTCVSLADVNKVKIATFFLKETFLAVWTLQQLEYVHRDIKPENIMVNKDGLPMFVDWGMVSFSETKYHELAEPEPSLTKWNRVWPGTFRYVAPDHIKTVSFDGDQRKLISNEPSCPSGAVFSLGVIAAELLKGDHLFSVEQDLQHHEIDGDQLENMSVKPDAILREVGKLKKTFTDHGQDLQVMEIVEQLLQPEADERGEVKKHLKHELFKNEKFLDAGQAQLRAMAQHAYREKLQSFEQAVAFPFDRDAAEKAADLCRRVVIPFGQKVGSFWEESWRNGLQSKIVSAFESITGPVFEVTVDAVEHAMIRKGLTLGDQELDKAWFVCLQDEYTTRAQRQPAVVNGALLKKMWRMPAIEAQAGDLKVNIPKSSKSPNIAKSRTLNLCFIMNSIESLYNLYY